MKHKFKDVSAVCANEGARTYLDEVNIEVMLQSSAFDRKLENMIRKLGKLKEVTKTLQRGFATTRKPNLIFCRRNILFY